ncbi:hypothetical protein GCM10027299_42260 [Larkinella ripae]
MNNLPATATLLSKRLVENPSPIPGYGSETDEKRIINGAVYHWLNWCQRPSEKAELFISWALNKYGLPSGVIALPFQYSGNLDSALKDRNLYASIRYESLILFIVCLAEIRDADQYKLIYSHVSTYFQQAYRLVPAFDGSAINTRMRLGHDPTIVQDAYNRRVFFFNENDFPITSVNQNDETSDEALIHKINQLIQQGISQRKIALKLSISQAKISRLITKSKQ